MQMHHALFATVVLAASACANAGELFLLGLVPQAYAESTSDNGLVVAGHDPQSYWYWTRETGVVQLIGSTVSPGNGVGGQGCISADGRFMSVSSLQGDAQKAEGTIYDIDLALFQPIGSYGFNCDIERCSIWGMTRDAQSAVGLIDQGPCDAIAFKWSAATNAFTNLGTLYFYKPSRANAVSNDGATIAGWNDDYSGYRQGAVWIRNAAGVYVQTNITAPPPSGTVPIKMREAGVVSGNGQWVYGIGRTGYAGGGAWRWSPATGVQPVGTNPTTDIGYVVGANFDGTRVLCFYGVMGSAGSFMWTPKRGYVSLATIAAEAGVVIPAGWALSLPLGMSEDGLTIVGTAFGPNGTSPFVLDLRAGGGPCPADLNADATVGAQDLAILLSAWGSLGGSADLNGDGLVGAQDLAVLLSAWGACP